MTTFDNHKNFAYSAVATAPSPAISGGSLVVTAGHGALFPVAPFNVVIWPAGAQPLASNAEIARVTARSTDTLTITRATEGSTARTVLVGDQIALAITAKMFTDIEVAIPDPAVIATSVPLEIAAGDTYTVRGQALFHVPIRATGTGVARIDLRSGTLVSV